jgi:hypothetical protein
MASVTEYLEKLQKLTQTNCEILQAINDSFFTKNNYLTATVDDNTYVIPSFISLDNKINALTENFNNLVYAPKTGEATFNFDGNSQTIELKGFNCTPESISLDKPEKFEVENNQIFKDFLSPSPYINFNISSIPNDINKVVIKKVVAMSDELKSEFSAYLTEVVNKKVNYKTSANISYEDLYKKISYYKKDLDYVEYDTVKQLPIRKTIGTGIYTIKSIDSHEIMDDLRETYVITLKEDLKYKLFDNTIEKYLQVGDELVTYDNSAKMRIIEIRPNSRQLKIEVLNGDYVNLVADTSGNINDAISDLSKIKFYSSIDFNNDKNINVAIEEDQYIALFISPLNDRMNIRAPWGTGVIVNTFALKNSGGISYNDFYKQYVSNIGDILYELTSIATNGVTKYSKDEFDTFTKYKPQIIKKDLTVYQINSHLNNSPTIQKIRNLYNQKIKYNSELSEIQKSIDNINSTLASISFDDTTNIRSVYESQLIEYNKKRNEVVSALNSISNEIAMAANDSDVPIENAKYHIRGFYNNPNDDIISPYMDHINGIRVWYRYKKYCDQSKNLKDGLSEIYHDIRQTWTKQFIYVQRLDKKLHLASPILPYPKPSTDFPICTRVEIYKQDEAFLNNYSAPDREKLEYYYEKEEQLFTKAALKRRGEYTESPKSKFCIYDKTGILVETYNSIKELICDNTSFTESSVRKALKTTKPYKNYFFYVYEEGAEISETLEVPYLCTIDGIRFLK